MTRLPRVPVVGSRQDFLVNRARGRRVLHVGCVDAGMLEDRYGRGEHLHLRLLGVARSVMGIDIEEEGIAYLKARGVPNLVVGDVCQRETLDALTELDLDLILASEVIEHLDDPGTFLEGVRALAIVTGAEILITVPNAFSLATLGNVLLRREAVHPDHNYWFSFVTIRTLLSKHGLEPRETWIYSFEPTAFRPSSWRLRSIVRLLVSMPRRALVRGMYAITPYWGDGLIVSARARA